MLQYIAYYNFSATTFTIVALIFLLLISFLRFSYVLLLICICRLIFVDCIFIFFQYTLNEQLTLRKKIGTRK